MAKIILNVCYFISLAGCQTLAFQTFLAYRYPSRLKIDASNEENHEISRYSLLVATLAYGFIFMILFFYKDREVQYASETDEQMELQKMK